MPLCVIHILCVIKVNMTYMSYFIGQSSCNSFLNGVVISMVIAAEYSSRHSRTFACGSDKIRGHIKITFKVLHTAVNIFSVLPMGAI